MSKGKAAGKKESDQAVGIQIEKYGSGYIRVRQEIAAYPTMRFDYEESGDGYLVSVNYQEQKTSSASAVVVKLNEGLNEGLNRLTETIGISP
jgi:ATP-dependent DNA helicase RecG